MATPIIISVPHQLGRAEARRRIEAGFAKIINLLPGSSAGRSERWEGDRLIFSVATMGQTVSGVIHAEVMMEIELPGVLRVIASGLKERLQKVGQLLLTRKSFCSGYCEAEVGASGCTSMTLTPRPRRTRPW